MKCPKCQSLCSGFVVADWTHYACSACGHQFSERRPIKRYRRAGYDPLLDPTVYALVAVAVVLCAYVAMHWGYLAQLWGPR